MRQRVLIVTNSIGGLHSFRKEIMKALIDNGYEVYISAPDIDERVKYFESIGCHIIKTDFDRRGVNPIADFKLFLRYRQLMKQLKPVVVLSYTIKPNVYGGIACRLTKTRQIANVTGLGDAVENGGWLQKLTIVLYKIGLGKARRIFFQNATNRNFCIAKRIADERSVLLPGSGVNLEHHRIQPYPKDDGKVRFLYIGRLLKDKGIEEYFEAARRIREKYPNTEFQILGHMEGNYQQSLKQLEIEGIIRHLGATTDVRPFIGAVDCTVMPSYHEGMSNVDLESAANGRPVITTDIPGCRETVDDGRTGYLVEARNVDSLVEAIERFIALPYSKRALMGQEGRKKMEREFDRQIVVNAYLEVINAIANV